jgi:signal transduction histidine kinase
MRGVEPEVVLALANLATMANLGGRLTMPLRSPDVRASDLEEERKRISRELHDGVAQELQAIVMHLRLALADDTDESACLATVTALAIAERGLAMTRSLLADLHGHGRPGCAPSESLARALSDSLCEATRYSILDVDLDLEEGVRISHQVYAELTRMVREIATNTIKHAKATTISCAIQPCANSASCQVKIRDDGIGFDVAATRAGCGMRGLRERAARIGATVSIESLSGQGTLVRLFVPTV